jgi:LysM repeat protein
VVRSGDYLSGIAPALGVKLSALLAANKLTVNSLIYPGMLLNVPAGGKLPAVAATNAAAGTSTTDSRIAKVLAFAQAQPRQRTATRSTTKTRVSPPLMTPPAPRLP